MIKHKMCVQSIGGKVVRFTKKLSILLLHPDLNPYPILRKIIFKTRLQINGVDSVYLLGAVRQ